jgi:Tfp pilus assembly protein PilX
MSGYRALRLERGDDMTDARRDGTGGRTSGAERSESGFALILALLALMLLTFLGLTLATSTSTELKIATNYRWQQQALYNAEAGIEAGKRILSGVQSWTTVLPTKRTASWTGGGTVPANRDGANATYANNDAWGNASRNFENGPCDKHGDGVGYGAVLDDGTGLAPYQYKTTLYGASLNGAFTLWVRRPVVPKGDGNLQDYTGQGDEDHLVLVAEGVAPYTGNQLTSSNAGNAAVQVVEVLLSKVTGSQQSPCQTRAGQSGQSAGGGNFASCSTIGAGGIAAANLGNTGTNADSGVK